jgi:hypothetical protein
MRPSLAEMIFLRGNSDSCKVYPHSVGTNEDHFALSNTSLEIFFSRSSDRNATIFAVKECNMQI